MNHYNSVYVNLWSQVPTAVIQKALQGIEPNENSKVGLSMDCTITPIRLEDWDKSTLNFCTIQVGWSFCNSNHRHALPIDSRPIPIWQVCVILMYISANLFSTGSPAHLYSPPCMRPGSPASTTSSATSQSLPGELFSVQTCFGSSWFCFVKFLLVHNILNFANLLGWANQSGTR